MRIGHENHAITEGVDEISVTFITNDAAIG